MASPLRPDSPPPEPPPAFHRPRYTTLTRGIAVGCIGALSVFLVPVLVVLGVVVLIHLVLPHL
jgi:hypothetical protein